MGRIRTTDSEGQRSSPRRSSRAVRLAIASICSLSLGAWGGMAIYFLRHSIPAGWTALAPVLILVTAGVCVVFIMKLRREIELESLLTPMEKMQYRRQLLLFGPVAALEIWLVLRNRS